MVGYSDFKKIRLGLQCLANICATIGICLTLTAMFTSGWLIAYSVRRSYYTYRDSEGQYDSTYEHGLYRDCVLGQDNIKPYGDWVCFWKFDQNNHIQTNRFFNFLDYQEKVLIILGVSCCLAVLSMISACVTCCVRYFSIAWTMTSFLTALSSFIGIIIFAVNASMSSNRFYREGDGWERDMVYGYAFYLAITGFITYLLAFILAGVCIGLSFLEIRQKTSGSNDKLVFSPNNMFLINKADNNNSIDIGKQTRV